MAKEYIDFQKERAFGDMIGAPFQFVFQEFKSLFLSILKYAGPFLLAAVLFLILTVKKVAESFSTETTSLMIIFFAGLIFALGILAMISTTYSYISAYVTYGKGNFTISDVGILLKRNVFKIFGGGFLLGIMVLPLFLLAIIPYIGLIAFYAVLFYLYVSMSMFAIITVHEDINIGKAFSRSFQLVKGKWWFTFGLYIVFSLIIMFASYIVMIPLYIGVFASVLSVGVSSVGIIILIIISVLLYLVLYFFIISLQHSLFSLQYFNLKARKEGPDLFDRISEINKSHEEEGNKEEKSDDLENNNKDKEQNRFEDDDETDRFKPKY